ncbi:tetratricopeptide repeat protein [Corallococcus macrosporus]|uniref:TPR repeat-containing protein n=1 Tax=Myxococcus fulvus (strain ATCC BAA-855 / HW-1) TaxID=483219 RepID=F8CBZ2_MYXFH|nr:tetratricopeptide repeat protein [Corallococcus macrosporus]AEI65958.1 TPR repeat-containing protein [Corallococcus macrosporus]
MGTEGRKDWQRRESLSSALVQVGVVAVVLAVAVAFFVHRGTVRKQAEEHLRAARAAAQRGNPADFARALAELEALFQIDAESRDAQALAADIQTVLWLEHRQPGADAKAREHLSRAERLESQSGERYGAHALHLLATGKAAEAEQYLAALEARGANNARLTLARALALQARGDLPGARQAFARAAETAWRDPRFTTAYGEALLDEGQYPQAVEAFARATSVNPDHLLARVSAALAHTYQGRKTEEARRVLARVEARGAELTPVLKARAGALKAELALAAGAPDDAIAAADAALKALPDEHYALFARARALAVKRDAQARAAFEAAVARRRNAPLLYLDGARALQAAGDGAGALALLDAYEATFGPVRTTTADGKQAGLLEKDSRYWLGRGGVLEAASRQDEALAAYDKALAARGVELARAQYAKGALLLARKDYEGARPLLAAVAPDNGAGTLAEAYTAMGDLLFAQGEHAAACQHYFFGLARARTQGTPREALAARVEDIRERLESAGQARMAKAWKAESGPLLE